MKWITALAHAPALDEVTTPASSTGMRGTPNFFGRDGEVTGLLDFERAMWADPLMEAQFRPLFGDGAANILRGYGKTTFTADEERRSHLFTLHLGLVTNTECSYRALRHRLRLQLSRWLLNTAMDRLRAG